jgi:hypothetical protein
MNYFLLHCRIYSIRIVLSPQNIFQIGTALVWVNVTFCPGRDALIHKKHKKERRSACGLISRPVVIIDSREGLKEHDTRMLRERVLSFEEMSHSILEEEECSALVFAYLRVGNVAFYTHGCGSPCEPRTYSSAQAHFGLILWLAPSSTLLSCARRRDDFLRDTVAL